MGQRKTRGRKPQPSHTIRAPEPIPASIPVWPLLPVLLAAVLFAYQPSWHGGQLWDDDAHLTRPELQGIDGLSRIWFDVGATQQYYPVVHSAFWAFHQLWGDATLGYHLVNIVLHATSAFLFLVLLRRLQVPGASIAAVVFALHPVHVESVAWITELKNTLSGTLYLLAAIQYVRFDETRRPTRYAFALVLFVLALLTKTVTATLPAALLVVFWWQRGALRWRRDVVPLLPFIACGVAAGVATAWFERVYIGAQGFEFELSFLDRVLIATRAPWFYASKLLWPSGLAFIYPRWQIDPGDLWQYLFPAATAGLLIALWRLRSRVRAPLAAALLFGGTLFPALGFFNVYPFRYSFVADHFQYLASLAPIALMSAAVVLGAKRWRRRPRMIEAAAMLAFGVSLGALTWQQAHQYADAETLYRSTLERNPSCWMCHNNLAKLRFESAADRERALAHMDEAVRINPRNGELHNNRGVLLRMMGRRAEALRAHEEAVRLSPDYAEAHNGLGAELQAAGRLDEALVHYEDALRLNPRLAEAHLNAGMVLQALGRVDEAIVHLRTALELRPNYAEAYDALGTAVARLGRIDEALAHFESALRIDPRNASAHNNRATALAGLGRHPEAAAEYEEAIRLNPADAKVADNLGYVLLHMGRRAAARARFEDALRIDPDYAPARVNLANLLMDEGRPADAIPHYEKALEAAAGGVDLAQVHSNLGSALALVGRRTDAIAHFQKALGLRPDFPQARANLARAMGVRER